MRTLCLIRPLLISVGLPASLPPVMVWGYSCADLSPKGSVPPCEGPLVECTGGHGHRLPNSRVTWVLYDGPGSSSDDNEHSQLRRDQWQSMTDQAIATWDAGSSLLPKDLTNCVLNMSPSAAFQIIWKTTSNMIKDYSASGVGLCGPSPGCGQYTSTVMVLCTDYTWAASDCGSSCSSPAYNYYCVALHEFGHAWGLGDNHNNGQLVMFDSYSSANRTPAPCEYDYIDCLYHENFGPSRVGNVRVVDAQDGAVEWHWTMLSESECGSFALVRVDAEGLETTIATGIPCQGVGTEYLARDDSPVAGATYKLLLTEVDAPGGTGPVLLAERRH